MITNQCHFGAVCRNWKRTVTNIEELLAVTSRLQLEAVKMHVISIALVETLEFVLTQTSFCICVAINKVNGIVLL